MSLRKFINLIFIFYLFLIIKQVYGGISDSGSLDVIFFNVGQGDAIYVKTPNNKTVLIDGGSSYDIDYFLYKLKPLQKCNLDVVVLTHPHKDHVFGLLRVLERCRVGMVLHNDVTFKSRAYNDFKNLLENKNVRQATIEQGSLLLDGVEFIILWPSGEFLNDERQKNSIKNPNNLSVVLLVDYDDTEVLLTGDAESDILQKIDTKSITSKVENGLDIYKVSHQGAKDGLNKAFIDALDIKRAVISVGNNSYGHPSEEVLMYFKSRKIEVLRTDQQGTIRFSFE